MNTFLQDLSKTFGDGCFDPLSH